MEERRHARRVIAEGALWDFFLDDLLSDRGDLLAGISTVNLSTDRFLSIKWRVLKQIRRLCHLDDGHMCQSRISVALIYGEGRLWREYSLKKNESKKKIYRKRKRQD